MRSVAPSNHTMSRPYWPGPLIIKYDVIPNGSSHEICGTEQPDDIRLVLALAR